MAKMSKFHIERILRQGNIREVEIEKITAELEIGIIYDTNEVVPSKFINVFEDELYNDYLKRKEKVELMRMKRL